MQSQLLQEDVYHTSMTKHLQLTGHAEISARNMIGQPDSVDDEDSGDQDADKGPSTKDVRQMGRGWF